MIRKTFLLKNQSQKILVKYFFYFPLINSYIFLKNKHKHTLEIKELIFIARI